MVPTDPPAIACFNSGDLTMTGAAAEWTEHIRAVEAAGFRAGASDWEPYSSCVRTAGKRHPRGSARPKCGLVHACRRDTARPALFVLLALARLCYLRPRY